jgi:hypothetical protein
MNNVIIHTSLRAGNFVCPHTQQLGIKQRYTIAHRHLLEKSLTNKKYEVSRQ